MENIRNIKIDKLLGIDNEILSFYNEICKNIESIVCNVYYTGNSEHIYFNLSKPDWIFYFDINNRILYVNEDTLFIPLQFKFKLNRLEICDILTFLTSEKLVKLPIRDVRPASSAGLSHVHQRIMEEKRRRYNLVK